jgi:hypothetical protein
MAQSTGRRTCRNLRHQEYILTRHAQTQMGRRGIPEDAVAAALAHGRKVHTRGAVIFAIGRKEIAREQAGVDLSHFDGVQVVVSLEGVVITVYRNRDFRQLRAGLGRGRYPRPKRSRPAGTRSYPRPSGQRYLR